MLVLCPIYKVRADCHPAAEQTDCQLAGCNSNVIVSHLRPSYYCLPSWCGGGGWSVFVSYLRPKNRWFLGWRWPWTCRRRSRAQGMIGSGLRMSSNLQVLRPRPKSTNNKPPPSSKTQWASQENTETLTSSPNFAQPFFIIFTPARQPSGFPKFGSLGGDIPSAVATPAELGWLAEFEECAVARRRKACLRMQRLRRSCQPGSQAALPWQALKERQQKPRPSGLHYRSGDRGPVRPGCSLRPVARIGRRRHAVSARTSAYREHVRGYFQSHPWVSGQQGVRSAALVWRLPSSEGP